MSKYIGIKNFRKIYYAVHRGEIVPCHLIAKKDRDGRGAYAANSNLDETAEEFAYNNWEDNDYHTGASEGLPFDAIGHTEKCFKAGAEWMAEQGETIGTFIEKITNDEEEFLGILVAADTFKEGDKVIVQIRKKQ